MSFEGYYQLICKNGHYYGAGLYVEEENTVCPFCHAECAWWNLVDTTNDEGYPVSVTLLRRRFCESCHGVLEEIYEIPNNKGHLRNED